MGFAVVLLGLLAASLFGLSSALQQRAAARADAREHAEQQSGRAEDGSPSAALPVRVARRLTHDRLWIAGVASNTCGFFASAAALQFGSVGLVQPLLTTQLLFAVVLASLLRKLGLPGRRDWAGGLLVCAGLAVFLAVGGAIPRDAVPVRSRALLALAGAVVIAVVLAVASRRRSSAVVSAALLGVGSGMFFAMTSLLVKLTTNDLLHRGVGATAVDWVGYALAGSALVSQLFEQSSFAAGPLSAALTAETATAPVVGYLIGVLTVGEPLPTTAASIAATLVGGALLVAGVVLLAHAPSMTRTDPAREQGRQQARAGGSS